MAQYRKVSEMIKRMEMEHEELRDMILPVQEAIINPVPLARDDCSLAELIDIIDPIVAEFEARYGSEAIRNTAAKPEAPVTAPDDPRCLVNVILRKAGILNSNSKRLNESLSGIGGTQQISNSSPSPFPQPRSMPVSDWHYIIEDIVSELEEQRKFSDEMTIDRFLNYHRLSEESDTFEVTLDPHASENLVLMGKAQSGNIGIELRFNKDDKWNRSKENLLLLPVVTSIIPGSPADLACPKICVGDFLLMVGGCTVQYLSEEKWHELVTRDDELLNLTITRKKNRTEIYGLNSTSLS